MHYSTLTEIPTTRGVTEVFGGYNHNLRIGGGEFYDMKNMTSDYYPVLAPRKQRGKYANAMYGNEEDMNSQVKLKGLIAKDKLCYVDGTDFVVGTTHVNMGLNDEPKQLISMGAYVIIMPDRKWINTNDPTTSGSGYEYGSIEASFTTTTKVTFELCDITGDLYTDATVSATAPEDPAPEGKTFLGWYTYEDGILTLFDFSQRVTNNIELYAIFVKNE